MSRKRIRNRIKHVRRFFKRRDDVRLGDVVGENSISDFLELAKPGQLKWAAQRVDGSKLEYEREDRSQSSSVQFQAGRKNGVSVSVEFENEVEHGTLSREAKFKLRGGASNKTYAVVADGNRLGVITTNSRGYGTLKLSTRPDDREEHWTTREARSITLNSKIRIGGNQLVTTLGNHSAYRNEVRNAISGPVETELHMRGSGGIRGTAEWEVEREDGGLEKKFEVKIRNAEANQSYRISVDGVNIGNVTANGRGRGEIEFTSRPDDSDEVRLPNNFPGIENGTKVEIGNVLSGAFGRGGGSDDSGNGNEFELKSRLGFDSGGRAGQAKFEQEREHGGIELKLRVQIKRAEANESLTVKVDGQAVGTLETNGRGRGRLELTNMPNHRREMALPSSFDGLSAGSRISVGDSISGFFATSPS